MISLRFFCDTSNGPFTATAKIQQRKHLKSPKIQPKKLINHELLQSVGPLQQLSLVVLIIDSHLVIVLLLL